MLGNPSVWTRQGLFWGINVLAVVQAGGQSRGQTGLRLRSFIAVTAAIAEPPSRTLGDGPVVILLANGAAVLEFYDGLDLYGHVHRQGVRANSRPRVHAPLSEHLNTNKQKKYRGLEACQAFSIAARKLHLWYDIVVWEGRNANHPAKNRG